MVSSVLVWNAQPGLGMKEKEVSRFDNVVDLAFNLLLIFNEMVAYEKVMCQA